MGMGPLTEAETFVVDVAQAIKGLTDVGEAAKTAHVHHKNFSDLLKEDFTRSFLTAHAAYDLFKEGLHEGIEMIKEGIAETLQHAQAMQSLDVVLRNVGNTSLSLRHELEEQAKAIEALTGKDDAETIRLAQLAASFGVLPEQIGRFVNASISMSSVVGSAETAMRLLAKSSGEGKEELKKYGIQANDVAHEAGDFRDVLTQVEKQMGNVNDKIPEQVKELNAAKQGWKELKEKMGDVALEIFAWANKPGWQVDNPLLRALGLGWEQQKVAKALAEEKTKELLEIIDHAAHHEEQKKRVITVDPKFIEAIAAQREKVEKEEADAAKKRNAFSEKAGKEGIAATMAFYQQQQELKKTQDAESAKLIAQDRKGDDEAQKVVDDHTLSQGESANEAKLEQERVFWAKKLAVIESNTAYQKQIEQDGVNFAKQIGQQLLSTATSLIKEQLLADTAYTRAVKANAEEQLRIGKSKAEGDAAVAAFETKSSEEATAALAEKTAAVLADIATQAGVKALMYGAEAIGFLVSEEYEKAANAGIAAGLFGAVAVAAGGSAAAINSNRGMTSSESASLASSNTKASKDSAAREAAQTAQRGGSTTQGSVYNIYHMGITGQTEVEQGRELERIRSEFDDTKTGNG